jgi:hypothetical protein
MTNVNHEVPTHLNVEDKVLFGLTVRQFLFLLVGCLASYALWQQAAPFGDVLRWTGAAMCATIALAFALLRPADRALEEWLAAALLFVAAPRRTIWRPREPLAADWRPTSGGWQELTPSPVWAEADGR